MIRAVFFDFGGVILTSPFEAFNRYERDQGLPPDFIRTVNATNPDDNAWARFERNDVDVDGFAELFEREAASRGHDVDGHAVLELIHGELRPRMVRALRRVKDAGLVTACLTNNFRSWEEATPEVVEVMSLFDAIVESSRVGVRKPEPKFYRRALAEVDVDASETVFLDDLGVNLKPARAMGMTTIKVVDPDIALTELGAVIGLDFGAD